MDECMIRAMDVNFRYEDFVVDVAEVLRERSQRYRICNEIFEDVDIDAVKDSNGGPRPAEDCVDFKHTQTTPTINFERIGVDVFDPSCAGKSFDEAKLHLNLCESKPANMINNPLFHISRSDLHKIIQRGFLKQQMKNTVIYNHINKYLFYMMSCHSSEPLVKASCDTLLYHLLTSQPKSANSLWLPSIDDIIMVFCNYGAPRELLVAWDTPLPPRMLPKELIKEPLPDLHLRNINWVLRVISVLMRSHKSSCYTVEELDRLLCIIITVSLDKYIMQMQSEKQKVEFSKCIKSILTAYPTQWQKQGKVSNLSQTLYYKLRNVCISDINFVITKYICCPGLGQKLAKSLTYAFMNGTVWDYNQPTNLNKVEVTKICKIFEVNCLLEMDYYTQYNVLLMLERAVTHLIFTSEDLPYLNKIRRLLSNLRIKSPHSEDMIDYLLVKELITRAATMWKLSLTEVN